MKHGRLYLVGLLFSAACGSSPTAPTPVAAPVPQTPPPVVVAPVTPTNPLLSDARFDRSFYQQFALGALDLAGRTAPLRRHLRPPLFYVMTVDNQGRPIDPRTVDATAAALINTTPIWNGGMGVEGVRLGTSEPAPLGCLFCAPDPSVEHHIAVKWDATTTNGLCARADVGGNVLTVFLRTQGCACLGLAVAPAVIKHELGHAMGYWHTDRLTDVMGIGGTATCDQAPSPREQFHAKVAYAMAPGTLEP